MGTCLENESLALGRWSIEQKPPASQQRAIKRIKRASALSQSRSIESCEMPEIRGTLGRLHSYRDGFTQSNRRESRLIAAFQGATNDSEVD
jgi:hypothetical protein